MTSLPTQTLLLWLVASLGMLRPLPVKTRGTGAGGGATFSSPRIISLHPNMIPYRRGQRSQDVETKIPQIVTDA